MYDIPETGFLRLPQVLSVIPLGKTVGGMESNRAVSETGQVLTAMHRLASGRHPGAYQAACRPKGQTTSG